MLRLLKKCWNCSREPLAKEEHGTEVCPCPCLFSPCSCLRSLGCFCPLGVCDRWLRGDCEVPRRSSHESHEFHGGSACHWVVGLVFLSMMSRTLNMLVCTIPSIFPVLSTLTAVNGCCFVQSSAATALPRGLMTFPLIHRCSNTVLKFPIYRMMPGQSELDVLELHKGQKFLASPDAKTTCDVQVSAISWNVCASVGVMIHKVPKEDDV